MVLGDIGPDSRQLECKPNLDSMIEGIDSMSQLHLRPDLYVAIHCTHGAGSLDGLDEYVFLFCGLVLPKFYLGPF